MHVPLSSRLTLLFGNPLLTILQTCYLCATQNVFGICDAFRLHHESDETLQTIQHLQGKASPVANGRQHPAAVTNFKKSPKTKLSNVIWKTTNKFSKIPLFLALNSSKFHHIFSSNDINFNHSSHSMWCLCSIMSINRTSAHRVSLSKICCPAPHIICLIPIQPAAFSSIIN